MENSSILVNFVEFCPFTNMSRSRAIIFFREATSGALYWFENRVTSFTRASIMKLGGSLTQIHEFFDWIAKLAKLCATLLISILQWSMEIELKSCQSTTHSSYVSAPAVAKKPPYFIVSTTSKQSDWMMSRWQPICWANMSPSLRAYTSAVGASTTWSR